MSLDLSLFYKTEEVLITPAEYSFDENGNKVLVKEAVYEEQQIRLNPPNAYSVQDLERVLDLKKPLHVIKQFILNIEITNQWDWFHKYESWVFSNQAWNLRRDSFEPTEDAPVFTEEAPQMPPQPVVGSISEEVREALVTYINSERDSAHYAGITYKNEDFQTDSQSILDIMGACITDEDTVWLTKDNKQVPLTSVELNELGILIAQRKKVLVYKARMYKDAIKELTNLEDLFNYLDNLNWE